MAIDLEVNPEQAHVLAYGAVSSKSGASIRHAGSDARQSLSRLDAIADDARFIVGHNITEFDLPHLAALAPQLSLLRKPAIDTLGW